MKWGWTKYIILPVVVICAFASYEVVVWRNLTLDHFFSKRVSVYEYGELKIVESVNEVGLHKKVVIGGSEPLCISKDFYTGTWKSRTLNVIDSE